MRGDTESNLLDRKSPVPGQNGVLITKSTTERLGLVFLKQKGQRRYFTNSKEITRGKRKGKVEITLIDGKKVAVETDDIERNPM